MTSWYPLQFFLSTEGVCEVEADSKDHRNLRCTCKTYRSTKRCKHTKFIAKKIEDNDGKYSVSVNSEDVSDEEIEQAMSSPETFRDFLVHRSKIEFIK